MQKNTDLADHILPEKIFKILDYTGLILIGIFSLGYFVFVKKFAELYISIPFLNFPIFIGEILLFFCLCLFLVKFKIGNRKLKTWHYLLFCWAGFILVKTFLGYLKWGPLAMRHAALFYYPIFIIFGFDFYRKDFFRIKALVFLLLTLIVIVRFGFIVLHSYFLITSFILTVVLLRAYMPRSTRNLLFVFLFLAISCKLFFPISRALLISNIITLVFITIAGLFVLKVKFVYELILGISIMIFIFIGILMFADKVNIMSFEKLKNLKEIYSEYNKEILDKKGNFNMDLREAKLYNPEVGSVQTRLVGLIGEVEGMKVITKELEVSIRKSGSEANIVSTNKMQLFELQRLELDLKNMYYELVKGSIDKEEAEIKIDEMSLCLKACVAKLEKSNTNTNMEEKIFTKKVKGDVNDLLFRVFIWRDMLSQFNGGNIFFGTDFGKPFRSISLEILNWADGEWGRDGWITCHNSYLEIFYRSGLMGVTFILGVLIVLFKMIKRVIHLKSITGVFLCGILINWFVAANALVLFELPYNAIPIWSLFGMVFAYLFE